jgi:hypothetical protein
MRKRLRTFAMLDTILAPDARSFEWHPKWGKGEQMGAFKDGEGNFFFAWFSPKGAVVRGFDHESTMSPFQKDPPEIWPGIFDGLPKPLAYATKEPAFALEEITFAFWALGREGDWRAGNVKPAKGPDPDGSIHLLGCFQKNFQRWADGYYGADVETAALAQVWAEKPIDWSMLEALNDDFDERAVREEAELLDWPIDLSKREPAKKVARKNKPRAEAPASGKAPPASFGSAEFVVRCEPTRVVLRVRDKNVAISHADIYEELFDLVKARLEAR